MQRVRIVDGSLRDAFEGFRQGLERLEAFGLGRFEHERLFDDERKVHRGRMEPLFEQSLGHVESADAVSVLQWRRSEHAFVHADAVVGSRQRLS